MTPPLPHSFRLMASDAYGQSGLPSPLMSLAQLPSISVTTFYGIET